jgi:hypothetical protein
MTEPTTLFDAPAGDQPDRGVYRPGTWLDQPPTATDDEDDLPDPRPAA